MHRNQLIAARVTGDQIREWCAAGWLDPRFRWTYTFPGKAWDLSAQCWSATLSAGGDAAVTATHALALDDIVPAWGDVRVLRTDGRPRRQRGMTVRKRPSLPDTDVRMAGLLRTTSFARSILEAAGLHGWTELDRALDRSVRLRIFDRVALDRVLSEWPDAPGHSALVGAIDRLDETAGLTRSELERRLIALVKESDLPTPMVNSIVHGMEVDVRWHGTRTIIEADGGEFHTSPADVARDIAKWRALEDLGYAVMRVNWYAVVYRPEETIERIQRFLALNSQPPVATNQAA
ncbi:MAG: DUF559 domain-containing protein [Solirubrobacteraceae bacterium]|nr:DUF559 domain-containing protein [Solirubrobacteraceae bacterium]